MVPGLTTKMLEPFADRIMVGFEACRQHYKDPEKVIVTGTPVRGDFFKMTKAQAREKLGLSGEKPLLVSFWGSLGASGMNACMADFLALEAAREPFYHIHGAGVSGYPKLMEALRCRGVSLTEHPALDVEEYLYDMGAVMRAADLVICRAGASTISELTALGVPALIVPLALCDQQPPGEKCPGTGKSRRGPGAARRRTPAARSSIARPVRCCGIRGACRPWARPWAPWASGTPPSGSTARCSPISR
jgi:UDP-N-acetylglucosamine:LPS N-acetylglucosamine transferase